MCLHWLLACHGCKSLRWTYLPTPLLVKISLGSEDFAPPRAHKKPCILTWKRKDGGVAFTHDWKQMYQWRSWLLLGERLGHHPVGLGKSSEHALTQHLPVPKTLDRKLPLDWVLRSPSPIPSPKCSTIMTELFWKQ